MKRFISLIVILAATAGTTLGWLAYRSPTEDKKNRPSSIRLPLTPADMKASRERPAIAIDACGHIVLAFASGTTDDARTLFLTQSDDGDLNFDEPKPFRTVPILRYASSSKRPDVKYSTNVLPRLSAHYDTTVLSWTEPIEGKVQNLVAHSSYGGRTFSEPIPSHGPKAGRPSYTALTTGKYGEILTTWLDHRNGKQQPFFSITKEDDISSFVQEKLVYAGQGEHGICPCCDLDILSSSKGTTFVAFRNNIADIREMYVSRLPAGATEFEDAVPVSSHQWKFPGCPHDGPVLAESSGHIYVTWMDGHSGKQRVYIGRSGMDKLLFTSKALDEKAPGQQGHPRIVASQGELHAVWDGSLIEEAAPEGKHNQVAMSGAGRAVMYARWKDHEDGPTTAQPVDPKPGVFQLNPSLAVGGFGDVYITWSEVSEAGKNIVVHRIPASSK